MCVHKQKHSTWNCTGTVPYIALFLKSVGKITVSVGEVRLQLNSTSIGVNGQIDQTLLIVHAGQVAVDDSMVGAQTEGSQITSNSSVMNNNAVDYNSTLHSALMHVITMVTKIM